MSLIKKLSTYLDIVKQGIRNKDQIIEALGVSAAVKNGRITSEALAVILKRRDICAACPFNSDNAIKAGIYIPDEGRNFRHCILCYCRIGYDDSKEFCLSCNCGARSWNERNPDKPPMEVKWKAFDIETNKEVDHDKELEEN